MINGILAVFLLVVGNVALFMVTLKALQLTTEFFVELARDLTPTNAVKKETA